MANLEKSKNFLSDTEKHLTFGRGHDRVSAIFQKALTKTVGDRNLQRAGGWCEPVNSVSNDLSLLSRRVKSGAQ